jgi:hypothetical protein
MGLFGRIKTGMALARDSLSLMANNPKLGLFPLIGGIAGILYLTVFLGVAFGVLAVSPEGSTIVILFLYYLGMTFISTFFAAGLVHQTRAVVLHDQEPSVRDGIDAAWEKKGPIFVWSVISATVSVIINIIENSDSWLAKIFAAVFSIAWTILTFFVVPVIIFEDVGVKGMFTRSKDTFKQTWGETAISLIGVQLITILLAIPLIAIGIGLVFVNVFVGIGFILLAILFTYLLAQTLQGIVKTALYLYATEGAIPSEFDDLDFENLAG